MAAGAPSRWWSKNTVAVVTGGNKGIGYDIVKGLAKNGVTTVLTARDPARGQEAVNSLKADGLDSVVFYPLEVTNAESIDKLATWLEKEFGGVDILINNAGILPEEKSYPVAKRVIDTNYYAVKAVTEKLFPLLIPGARIVNVSSVLGQLSHLGSDDLRKKLGDVEQLNEELVDSYASKYLEAVKAGRWIEEGWCYEYPQYSDSKIFLNAYTRVFARTLSSRPDDHKIYVTVMHPGYVATNMNNFSGTLTTEQGADTAVWLALLPEENYPNGQFFYQREQFAW